MKRVFIALLSMLFLSPLANADNDLDSTPQMLDESKNKMMQKSEQATKSNKNNMKDRKGKQDTDYNCSDQGQEHGKCDEIIKKGKDKQRDKSKMTKDKLKKGNS
ncbi:hypothetical protein L4C38_18005 [Vibrio kasasachensis]|uniref:hypothetical protein n=1 Tax=Vibrio kasasachensis TaxID=2910248 RepID=UPI003D12232A